MVMRVVNDTCVNPHRKPVHIVARARLTKVIAVASQLILPAANILQLTAVKDACCEFLHQQLHPSNCLGIRSFADLHGCHELLATADNFIEQNFVDVVQHEEFLTLTAQQVGILVSSDKLSVPGEEQVSSAGQR